MSGRRSDLIDLARADERYAVEAYEFLCHSLAYTQRMLGKRRPSGAEGAESKDQGYHVTGQDLLEGVRRFALEQFGMMSCVVFRLWGVRSTGDFGRMVYNLIDAGLWHKSPTDRLEDFERLYDFEQAFVHDYRIDCEEE